MTSVPDLFSSVSGLLSPVPGLESSTADTETAAANISTRRRYIGDERAVSTVLDVALCLVLMSAAVGVLGIYLAGDEDTGHTPETATHAVELLGSTTVSVEYTLEPALERAPEDAYDDPDDYSRSELTRVTHGPAAGVLADAALANVSLEDEPLTQDGRLFATAIEGPIVSEFAVVDGDVAVAAHWTPYEGAPLEGRARIGPTPSPTADVSSVSMTVPSGFNFDRFDSADFGGDEGGGGDEGESRGENGNKDEDENPGIEAYHPIATSVSTAIVEGYFPPEQTSLVLERGGLDRDRTVYRYERFATALDGINPADLEGPLEQSNSDAQAANAHLVGALAESMAADMEARFDTPEEAVDTIAVEDVTIVVRVWET
ncbi:hypothetical protein ACFQO4_12310 [Saliphagus sp. GCM10025334]